MDAGYSLDKRRRIMAKTKILIVDDHTAIRDSFHQAIEASANWWLMFC